MSVESLADQYFGLCFPLEDELFGITITIIRGDYETENVPACVQITENEVVDQETGVQTVIVSRDYIIDKNQYLVNDEVVIPQRRDILRQTINGQIRHFEVVPMSPPGSSKNLPAWEEEDTDGVRWLVRTKEIKETFDA